MCVPVVWRPRFGFAGTRAGVPGRAMTDALTIVLDLHADHISPCRALGLARLRLHGARLCVAAGGYSASASIAFAVLVVGLLAPTPRWPVGCRRPATQWAASVGRCDDLCLDFTRRRCNPLLADRARTTLSLRSPGWPSVGGNRRPPSLGASPARPRRRPRVRCCRVARALVPESLGHGRGRVVCASRPQIAVARRNGSPLYW